MAQAEPHLNIQINGRRTSVLPGQTLAAALSASGHRVFRRNRQGAARGLFCGMGACFECLVTVNGLPDQRACMIPVEAGMRVELPGLEETDFP